MSSNDHWSQPTAVEPMEPRQLRILTRLAAASTVVVAFLLRDRITQSLQAPSTGHLIVLVWIAVLIGYLAIRRCRMAFCYVLPLIVVIGALASDRNSIFGSFVHMFGASMVVLAISQWPHLWAKPTP